MAKQKRRIYCKFCDYFCYTPEDFVSHLEKHHDEMIPEDMTPWQFSYYLRTGKTHGNCIICKTKTEWNEKTHKYARFCKNPKCKDKYRDIFKNRMIGKYGKTHLLNDPEQQKKMLANRKISGEYVWRDHTTKTTYTGSYEKNFLEFLDEIMNFDPSDIMAPSPHTYFYEYEGEKHFYIPDFFIPSLDLEIEIKDGGDNANMHPKIQAVDKVKEKLKDDVMMKNHFNYIKITNQNHEKFFEYLSKAKEQYFEKIEKPIYILESELSLDNLNELYTENTSIVTEGVHWDTMLTRPEVYLNKSFTVYHYSNNKKDMIVPITVNAGNKLAKPRFSSWWTPYKSQAGWALMGALFTKFKDNKWKELTWTQEAFKESRVQSKIHVGVIGESFFEKNKDTITSIEVYEHEKTFKGKDLGRGNEYSVDEFTCDFAVKPDKVRKVTWDEIKNYVKIVPDEDLPKYAKALNDMRLDGKNLQDMVHNKKPWLYWEFETASEIRNKYCKDHGIEFEIDEEYFRFTYKGQGIYQALKETVGLDIWSKLIKTSSFTWLPKPDSYPSSNLSYFTKKGRDEFMKKVLPICKKYLGDDIEYLKVKNLKNIVYRDEYQVIIDTKDQEGEKS